MVNGGNYTKSLVWPSCEMISPTTVVWKRKYISNQSTKIIRKWPGNDQALYLPKDNLNENSWHIRQPFFMSQKLSQNSEAACEKLSTQLLLPCELSSSQALLIKSMTCLEGLSQESMLTMSLKKKKIKTSLQVIAADGGSPSYWIIVST